MQVQVLSPALDLATVYVKRRKPFFVSRPRLGTLPHESTSKQRGRLCRRPHPPPNGRCTRTVRSLRRGSVSSPERVEVRLLQFAGKRPAGLDDGREGGDGLVGERLGLGRRHAGLRIPAQPGQQRPPQRDSRLARPPPSTAARNTSHSCHASQSNGLRRESPLAANPTPIPDNPMSTSVAT